MTKRHRPSARKDPCPTEKPRSPSTSLGVRENHCVDKLRATPKDKGAILLRTLASVTAPQQGRVGPTQLARKGAALVLVHIFFSFKRKMVVVVGGPSGRRHVP